MEKNIEIEDGRVLLRVNPKVYSLEVIYSTAYVFLDKAYIILDGDPKTEVLVRLKPKKPEDLEILGEAFFNELINYADYQKRAERTKKIREVLLQRAIITNDPSIVLDDKTDELLEDGGEEENYLDDPEGIAIPWEEKYGDKKNDNKAK